MLDNLKLVRRKSGLLIPTVDGSRVQAFGNYTHRVRQANGIVTPWVTDSNLLPTEGLTYLAGILGSTSKIATWYMALYAGAYSPAAGLTAANFTSTTSEITSGSEGFTEANRVTWTPDAAAAGAIVNDATPAAFTIITATALTVNGAGLLSAQAKGATTGTLLSATRFSSARSLNDDDVFEIKYTITLTSS